MLRVLALAFVLSAPAAAQGVAEPEGFRGEPYRAPTPDALAGATTVGTEEARALWEGGDVAFVDVLPRDARPPDLPEGTVWRDRPHDSIAGAIWLPNVGYAQLPPEDAAYLADGLARATDGDPARPVLFFCRSECWMSWNAAKRAIAQGYGSVYWYPEGTDGWAAAGLATARVEPLDPSAGPGADETGDGASP